LILYNYFRSSASYRVRLVLEYKKIQYEYRPVHLLKKEQFEPEYKKLNPLSQVPCLVDGDFTLTQSMAICLYLDKKFPENPLIPKDPHEASQVMEFCEMINCTQPLQNLSVLEYLKQEFYMDERGKKNWLNKWIGNSLVAMEIWLNKHSNQFAFKNQPTLADCFLLPQVFSSRRFEIDLSPYPNILRLETALNELEWVKLAHPLNQIDSPK
jgi:maleylacetoacetate isomerase